MKLDRIIFGGRDRLQIYKWDLAVNKVLLCVIIQLSRRAVHHAKRLFHAADRTQHMRLINHFASAGADENIL